MFSISHLSYLKNLPEPPEGVVICVDLDGTLVRSDTFFESITPMLQRGPFAWFSVLSQFFKGRAALKGSVASHGSPKAETLAWREELVEALRRWKANGHELILATASHYTMAEAVEKHLGLFDHVIGTQDGNNLRGEAKLDALRELAKGRPIWYLGDSFADLPLWKEVGGVAIAPLRYVARRVRKMPGVHLVEERRPSLWAIWSRALRLHQWSKNLLLLLPVLLAYRLGEPGIVKQLFFGIASFCTAASAVYLINDLLDLPSDRKHPIKQFRPLAAGWISALHALIAIPLLLALSLCFAWWVGRPAFFLVWVLYISLTTLYSLSLKKVYALDVLVLGVLYILRLFAGGAATATPLSFWLIAFAFFFFTSLALLKRVTDLQKMEEIKVNALGRRSYFTKDLPVLRIAGVTASMQAMTVFLFYINSSHFRSFYASPDLFWIVFVALVFWLLRIWIVTGRGEMLEDPVLFAVKDRWSWALGLIVLGTTWLAASSDISQWIELLGSR